MRTIVVDAGHGGEDRGGRSLGTPEKDLALRYAKRIGRDLQALGHRVLYTRDRDVFVPLQERAREANEAGADLFLSVHANASQNPNAWGPWTIHAAGSERGEEIARALQPAMVGAMGGNPQAVYPDASGWTGGRRLAVLRRTRMPAVLLELGFMTNPEDLQRLENPAMEVDLSGRIAEAVHLGLGGDAAAPEPAPPEIAVPPLPHPSENDRPLLEPIQVPTREHVETAAARLGLTGGVACAGAELVEEIARAMAAGSTGVRGAIAGELLDAFRGFREGRCG